MVRRRRGAVRPLSWFLAVLTAFAVALLGGGPASWAATGDGPWVASVQLGEDFDLGSPVCNFRARWYVSGGGVQVDDWSCTSVAFAGMDKSFPLTISMSGVTSASQPCTISLSRVVQNPDASTWYHFQSTITWLNAVQSAPTSGSGACNVAAYQVSFDGHNQGNFKPLLHGTLNLGLPAPAPDSTGQPDHGWYWNPNTPASGWTVAACLSSGTPAVCLTGFGYARISDTLFYIGFAPKSGYVPADSTSKGDLHYISSIYCPDGTRPSTGTKLVSFSGEAQVPIDKTAICDFTGGGTVRVRIGYGYGTSSPSNDPAAADAQVASGGAWFDAFLVSRTATPAGDSAPDQGSPTNAADAPPADDTNGLLGGLLGVFKDVLSALRGLGDLLKGLFVPSTASLDMVKGLRDDVMAKPPASVAGAFVSSAGSVFSGFAGSCSQFPDFGTTAVPIRLPCDPGTSFAGLREFVAVALVVYTVFYLWNMTTAALGGRSASGEDD